MSPPEPRTAWIGLFSRAPAMDGRHMGEELPLPRQPTRFALDGARFVNLDPVRFPVLGGTEAVRVDAAAAMTAEAGGRLTVTPPFYSPVPRYGGRLLPGDSMGFAAGAITVDHHGRGEAFAAKRPCADCPFRKDAEIGKFPASMIAGLRDCASEGLVQRVMVCHKLSAQGLVCAAFLARHGRDHGTVRLALAAGDVRPEQLEPKAGWPDLYASFEEMAEANGAA